MNIDEEYQQEKPVKRLNKKKLQVQAEDSEAGYATANEQFYEANDDASQQTQLVQIKEPTIRVRFLDTATTDFSSRFTLDEIRGFVDERSGGKPYIL